ncbi:MAG: symmetrical bis(5'-nucleosyl)-tetraphosphatase [Candidatus Endonucleobacter bathymodioli]|uniref:bis(5'-nucleosyl)-tetraphosphatase (symmetrical) n=1 Tax=Candidatus Endonucleibacter bathymodioli TaxID=539814 RepID=A0AA90SXD4_9GAMM|nr:symmetrical bis(5'-nucleosyl)-tetraphosphatase [Candidatus Endonucleobacter bathymodioli]
MTVYAVGDIQGCYDPLRRLLDKIVFDPGSDVLWVVGDMVNRGPESLATLRFLKSLGSSCTAILGNHDLHLLAIDAGIRKQKKKDTLEQILVAPDKDDLLRWLRFRPFLHHNKNMNITMVHAGIPPIWDLNQAKFYAQELGRMLQDDGYRKLLKILFESEEPTVWDAALGEDQKLRLAATYFTRMRFCDREGRIELKNKDAISRYGFAPWYTFTSAPMYEKVILFGHWSALEGETGRHNIHALDTGCVWGRRLTVINLQTFERVDVENSDC